MNDRFCLIVDDEPGIRTYLRAILENHGIESLEAGDAMEALGLLRKCGDRIDLIITDIRIPGDMNGLDLAYTIKKLKPAIRVMLMSGNAEIPPTEFELINKPFRPATIYNAIEAVTNRARAAS